MSPLNYTRSEQHSYPQIFYFPNFLAIYTRRGHLQKHASSKESENLHFVGVFSKHLRNDCLWKNPALQRDSNPDL